MQDIQEYSDCSHACRFAPLGFARVAPGKRCAGWTAAHPSLMRSRRRCSVCTWLRGALPPPLAAAAAVDVDRGRCCCAGREESKPPLAP